MNARAYATDAAWPALLAVSVPRAEAELAAYRLWEHDPLAVEEREGADGVLLLAGFAHEAGLEEQVGRPHRRRVGVVHRAGPVAVTPDPHTWFAS